MSYGSTRNVNDKAEDLKALLDMIISSDEGCVSVKSIQLTAMMCTDLVDEIIEGYEACLKVKSEVLNG